MTRAAILLAEGVATLRGAGLATAANDARALLSHAMAIPRERLLLRLQDNVTEGTVARFQAGIEARARMQPVAQIIGRRAFYGRDFIVTPDVLDPRPETETLIELALDRQFGRLLDLGTGSGAIALTLLAERPQAQAVAVDISSAALDVARKNAQALGVLQRAEFRRSNWFEQVEGRFDLIVSNPPYIGLSELDGLSVDVRAYEPHIALVPENDDGTGLAAYRIISAMAGQYLAKDGWLIVEIGYQQGDAVQSLLQDAGFRHVGLRHDLSGHPRVVFGQAGDL